MFSAQTLAAVLQETDLQAAPSPLSSWTYGLKLCTLAFGFRVMGCWACGILRLSIAGASVLQTGSTKEALPISIAKQQVSSTASAASPEVYWVEKGIMEKQMEITI